MEKVCFPSPPHCCMETSETRIFHPGFHNHYILTDRYFKRGCMFVCLSRSENVSLDCSFIEVLFTSDRALECFKPQIYLFFFGHNLTELFRDIKAASFGAGVRNHTSSHAVLANSLSLFQRHENSFIFLCLELVLHMTWHRRTFLVVAFLQLTTAHLLFEAGCSKFAIASMLFRGFFVRQRYLRPASGTAVVLHYVQINHEGGNSMHPSELPS